MANAKKSTASASKARTTTTKAKKPATKAKVSTAPANAAATRKTTSTKAPVKRSATTKPAAKKATPKSDFMTIQPTRETAYWLIFSLLILALGIWVLTLTIRINDIYDQIERNNSAVSSLDAQTATRQAGKAATSASE